MASHSKGPNSTAEEIYSLAEFLKETVGVEKDIDVTGLGGTNQNHKIIQLFMLEKTFKIKSNY